MPCLLTLVALITPRLLIAVLWLFTSWFAVLPSGIWILLGFIFLPTTLLWYSAGAALVRRRMVVRPADRRRHRPGDRRVAGSGRRKK